MNVTCALAVFCCIGCANFFEEPLKQYLEFCEQQRIHQSIPNKKHRILQKAEDKRNHHFMK